MHGALRRSQTLVARAMTNKNHRKKNFTPAEDGLIRQQPITGIGIGQLAQILRTNQPAVRHRATELGVSLVISDTMNTRTLRCADGFVDPLLERLKNVYGK